MADYLSGITNGLGSFAKTAMVFLPYLLGLLVIAGIAWYIIWVRSYNRPVMFLKITGTGFRLIKDKAKLFKDKSGVSFYKCKKTKLVIDVPPSEALVGSAEGDLAIGYVNSLGEVVWSTPGYNPLEISQKMDEIKKRQKKETGKELSDDEAVNLLSDKFDKEIYQGFIKSFKPLTTNQRASYAYQADKARSELKLNFLKENFPIILGGVFLVLIIAVTLMLGPKLLEQYTALSTEIGSQIEKYNEQKIESQKLQNDIYGTVQRIESSLNLTNQATPGSGVTR